MSCSSDKIKVHTSWRWRNSSSVTKLVDEEKYCQGVYQGPEEIIQILGVFRNSKSSVNFIRPPEIQLTSNKYSL